MQSSGQVCTLSLALQTPLPQLAQSRGQGSSKSQVPSQASTAQSSGQLRRLSEGPQVPSPQREVVEQSPGQLTADSLSSQSPSPQLWRQSGLQLCPPSSGLHTASPQKQSAPQARVVSPGSQYPLPHTAC